MGFFLIKFLLEYQLKFKIYSLYSVKINKIKVLRALGPKGSHLLVCVSACVNKILGNTLLCSSCRIFELRWKNSLLRKKAAVEKLIETSVPELYQQLVLTNRPTIQLRFKKLWMLSACCIEHWNLTNMCMISIRKIK